MSFMVQWPGLERNQRWHISSSQWNHLTFRYIPGKLYRGCNSVCFLPVSRFKWIIFPRMAWGLVRIQNLQFHTVSVSIRSPLFLNRKSHQSYLQWLLHWYSGLRSPNLAYIAKPNKSNEAMKMGRERTFNIPNYSFVFQLEGTVHCEMWYILGACHE